MQQKQNIGSHNSQQGLPEERNQDATPKKQSPVPELLHPVKPAVTDDEGNLHGRNENKAKGYSEQKPTEARSDAESPK